MSETLEINQGVRFVFTNHQLYRSKAPSSLSSICCHNRRNFWIVYWLGCILNLNQTETILVLL